jgi:hypothetical protein
MLGNGKHRDVTVNLAGQLKAQPYRLFGVFVAFNSYEQVHDETPL